jgi:uncharacterized protein
MLDLKKLLDGSLNSIEFSQPIEECDFLDGIVKGSAVASGIITNHSGLVILEGEIKPDLTVTCARCGKELDYFEPIRLYAKITDKLANEDEDEFILMEDFAIDPEDIVRTALILELPTKYLCKEDCKGLCSKCGSDLNKGECGCNTKERDPRWDVLKDYFGE